MIQSILLVSYYTPDRGHAGGLRLLDLYTQIRRINQNVRLELLTCKDDTDWDCNQVDDIFDVVHWMTRDTFNADGIKHKKILERDYDVIDLQYHQSGRFISIFRKNCSKSKIIFSPMESQVRAAQIIFLSDLRDLTIKSAIGAVFLAIKELLYCMHADHVGCVSFTDMHALKFAVPKKKLFCVQTGLSSLDFVKDSGENKFCDSDSRIERSKKLVYLAYFGSKTNRDALHWFCKLVHPMIKEQVPEYELMVVGRGLDDKLLKGCAFEGVRFIGEVPNIVFPISSATGGIAPARSGAGVRGKIHQYAALGVPCVTSNIGAASLKYKHGDSIFLADSALDFARYCITLLTNQKIARKMGTRAQALCLSNYTWDAMEPDIKKLYYL